MGEIIVDIELENPVDRHLLEAGVRREDQIRRATIPAVADTGAVMLALPLDVVRHLGLDYIGSTAVSYADGRREEVPIAGPVAIRIGNRNMNTDCLVVPNDVDPLIGQLVMEELDLVADCRARTLTPNPKSPDIPLLRI